MEYIKPNGHRSSYDVVTIGDVTISVDKNERHVIFEKYRPRIVSDLILPSALLSKVKQIIETKTIPNLLFYSTNGGTGKDSILSVIKAQVPLTMLTINASVDRSIDIVRTKIMQFVATPSMDGTRKVCYLTEAGGMTSIAMDSLKSIIEDYSNRVSFVMTTNSLSNLTQPLISRFEYIDLNNIPKDERSALAMKTFMRLGAILQNENVSFDHADLGKLVYRYFPSYRELMNGMKRSTIDGKLVVTDEINSTIVNEVITHVNNEDFPAVVKMSEVINVHSFAQEMNRLHYSGLLASDTAFVAFIPALNELQQSIAKAVPFLNVSFSLFCLSLIKAKVKLLLQ